MFLPTVQDKYWTKATTWEALPELVLGPVGLKMSQRSLLCYFICTNNVLRAPNTTESLEVGCLLLDGNTTLSCGRRKRKWGKESKGSFTRWSQVPSLLLEAALKARQDCMCHWPIRIFYVSFIIFQPIKLLVMFFFWSLSELMCLKSLPAAHATWMSKRMSVF